jgi:succinate-acetate transporter protein
MMAIGPVFLFVVCLIAFVVLAKTGKTWMNGVILSVSGFVGVLVVLVHIIAGHCTLIRLTPDGETMLVTLVFSTISLFIGLIMAIHGLRKK